MNILSEIESSLKILIKKIEQKIEEEALKRTEYIKKLASLSNGEFPTFDMSTDINYNPYYTVDNCSKNEIETSDYID